MNFIRKDRSVHAVFIGDGVQLFAANSESNGIASHRTPCALVVLQLDGLGAVARNRVSRIDGIVLLYILIRFDGYGVGVVVNLLKVVTHVAHPIEATAMRFLRTALYKYQQGVQEIITGSVGRGR